MSQDYVPMSLCKEPVAERVSHQSVLSSQSVGVSGGATEDGHLSCCPGGVDRAPVTCREGVTFVFLPEGSCQLWALQMYTGCPAGGGGEGFRDFSLCFFIVRMQLALSGWET